LAVVVIKLVRAAKVVGFVVVADVVPTPAVVAVLGVVVVVLAVDVVTAAAGVVVELIRPRMVLSEPLIRLVWVARAE
jgi:hypothetical protein